MTVVGGRCSQNACVIHVHGPLRVPVSRDLRHDVQSLLRRGERGIVLDLARVSRIDAAGVGELVRAYNMAVAASGTLRIVHTNAWVRELLDRVGLVGLLTGDWDASRRSIGGADGPASVRSGLSGQPARVDRPPVIPRGCRSSA
jgi:anti-anti-sigma factor